MEHRMCTDREESMPAEATDRERRRQEITALVLELGSYAAAAVGDVRVGG